jgi:NodT family efflux transporter outer membrane factor (OMF) lipoprotein
MNLMTPVFGFRGRHVALNFSVLLYAILLGGCATVGPDYERPEIATPNNWTSSKEQKPLDETVLAQWWLQFKDPVLNNLVSEALTANLDLATARAQLREARAKRNQSEALLWPEVGASASAARNTASKQTGSGETTKLYNAGFDASWEIDLFGGLRRGAEATQADYEATQNSLRDIQVSLISEVVLNYVELRTYELRLTKAQANLESSKETYQLAAWREQAGLVSVLDVAQSRTELENVYAALPALYTAMTAARNRLALLLGLNPGELDERLSPTSVIPLPIKEIDTGIPADVLRQRPDIRAAERQLAAQTARVGEAVAARYPSFTLSGTLGLEAFTAGGLNSSDALTRSLLAGITVPIFDAGRIKSNIEIQDALLEQARLNYQSAILTALEDVENALATLANTSERHNRLIQAVESAREALQIAEYQYSGGLTDFLTVLDSQRSVLDLEDQLASSTGDLASAHIQLYKALGGGWSPESQPDAIASETNS